jgi:ribose 5-phosphate isomerase B
MEIHLGADHRGWEMKNKLKEWLENQGYKVTDHGAAKLDPNDDYPDFAFKVAQAVGEDAVVRRGIVVCGSGVGMAVAANKVKGVRAAMMHTERMAEASRKDDDTNVLALGADFIDLTQAQRVIDAWLTAKFSHEERHQRRIQKVEEFETKQP